MLNGLRTAIALLNRPAFPRHTGLFTLANPAYGTAVIGRLKPENELPRNPVYALYPNKAVKLSYGIHTLIFPDGSTYKNEGYLYSGITDSLGRTA